MLTMCLIFSGYSGGPSRSKNAHVKFIGNYLKMWMCAQTVVCVDVVLPTQQSPWRVVPPGCWCV